MENHGVQYKTRFKQMRESVLAMKALWTQEEGAYHGEFVNFDPAWSYPKPAQRPHPPIILGGETDYTLRRVVEYCDGWLPRGRGNFDAVEGMARLRAMADEAGRDMASLSVTVFGAAPDAQKLEAYGKAGIDGALLMLPSADRETILPMLDKFAPLLNA